jgi:hypothetical protein
LIDLLLYFEILRRQWIVVIAITLLAAIASLIVALLQPAQYAATARLLVTIADPTRVDIEDPLAYDVPAIIHGRPFAQDVSALLVSQHVIITADAIMQALRATNQKREVFLTATSFDPSIPIALLRAAAEQLQAGGLRYWGGAAPIPERPGLRIVLLEMPDAVQQSNGPSAIAREVALRTLAGLAVGCGLAFGIHAVGETKGQR